MSEQMPETKTMYIEYVHFTDVLHTNLTHCLRSIHNVITKLKRLSATKMQYVYLLQTL